MRIVWSVLAAAALVLAATPPAAAQSDGTFAVGLTVGVRPAPAIGVAGHTSVGLTWRFGHSRTGWGWQYGLGWYATDLEQAIGGQGAPFGELEVRPFMGGYGYTQAVGRTAVTAKLLGGYAFNRFEVRPSFDDQYRTGLGARSVTTKVSNGFVVKPEVSAWFDVNRKVGLQMSASYTVARPTVTISSSLGDDSRHIRADVFTLKIGAVYSIF